MFIDNSYIKKLLILALLLVTFLSSIVLSNGFSVSASYVVGTEQTYVTIDEMYREDNSVFFTLHDNIALNQITYEYTHSVDGEVESDLVSINPSKQDTKIYKFDLTPGTLAVKIWKIRYKVSEGYFKNKYTNGFNFIGVIESVKKKNYISVTADKLVSYEYNSKKVIELPWWAWSGAGIMVQGGDYLFNNEKSASYTWYFSVDKEIDEIIDVDLEYATFEYTEALWGLVESKHDYKTSDVTINSDTSVFDYENYVKTTEEYCSGLLESVCNERIMELGENTFKRNAIGESSIDGYDWYVQVTLDDLLASNNVLWGAYENKEYLQEVSLLRISYYFEGEYFDVSVLDEDTGELVIVPDPSPIDKIVELFEDVSDWFTKVKNYVKSHSWIFWIVIAVVLLSLLSIFWGPFKIVIRIVFFPITIIIYAIKKAKRKKIEKEDKKFRQDVRDLVNSSGNVSINNNKNSKINKKIRKNKYNGNTNYYKTRY